MAASAPILAVPILGTKLYIPPPPPKVVVRTRLIERLDEGLAAGAKLTLISAPAGFGKTTLVSEWVSHFRFSISDFGVDSSEAKSIKNPQSTIQNPRVAWLSLDEGDSDLTRFLSSRLSARQGNVAMIWSISSSSMAPASPRFWQLCA